MPVKHFYKNIEGWFNFDNIYKSQIDKAKDGSHFVEIGAYKGRSAGFMAVEIANSGKKVRFDVIDPWYGQVYNDFTKNMKHVKNFVNPIRGLSLDVVKTYKDTSLDFVFVDGAHEYEDVLEDIKAWHPKMKKGGFFAGHDLRPEFPGVRKAVEEYFEAFEVDRSSWYVIV